MSAVLREILSVGGPGAEAVRRLDRSARTPALLGFPGDAGSILRSLALVVVGLGSIGMHLADRAARAGVRLLLLVDPGRTKLESLLTHPLAPADVGRPKAVLAGERARALSPETRVLAFEGPVQELPWDALVGASHVLVSSDNLACEVDAARRCLELGLPLAQAAVYGRALVATTRLFPHSDAAGPCAACQFTAGEWDDLDRQTVFSCADAGRRSAPTRGPGPATVSPPELCALAADLTFLEVVKHALGLGPAEEGTLIEYSGFPTTLTRSPLVRRDDCPLPHQRTAFVRPERRLAGMRLRDVLRAAADGVALERLSVAVEGHLFARRAMCACAVHPPVGRFVPAGGTPPPCPVCGAPLHPHPFATDREVAGAWLRPHVERTLAGLGLAEPCPPLLVRGELAREDGAAAVLLADDPPMHAGPTGPTGGAR